MNKFKKVLATAVALVSCATSVIGLSACGDTEKTDFNKDVEVVAYDGSAVEISFYHSMGNDLKEILNNNIPTFNAMFPNITVTHQAYSDYTELRTKIVNMVQSRKNPALAFCYPDHVALYKTMKAVTPLDGFIDSELTVTHADETTEQLGLTQAQKDDFVKAYYDEGKVYDDGKMYTLPFAKSTEVLYYNKTEFEKNGWQVPTTWDEMETLCATIKAKYPTHVPLGYDSEANWFITMTEQLGSDYLTLDGEKYVFANEENYKFVERFKGWFDKGYFTTESINKNYTSNLFTETDPSKPKCYMCIGSTGGATYQKPAQAKDPVTGKLEYVFEAGVAQIPQIDPANPKVIQQGPSLCVFKNDNPQVVAASWLFTKFLATCVDLQSAVSIKNGYSPVINSVINDENYVNNFLNKADGYSKMTALAVKQAIEQQNAYYISPAFNRSAAARDEVALLMTRCFTGAPKSGQSMADFIKSEFAYSIKTLKEDD